MCDSEAVKGSEFPRKLHRLSRRRGVRFQYEPGLGKGSHGRVSYKELGPGLLRAMCNDLGIDPRDL
jgi:mRNA interferase HicA